MCVNVWIHVCVILRECLIISAPLQLCVNSLKHESALHAVTIQVIFFSNIGTRPAISDDGARLLDRHLYATGISFIVTKR